MKRICVSVVICLCFVVTGFAQNSFYWIGPTNGNWNNGANWSETQGGSTKNAAPSSAAHNVFFPASATLNLNTSVSINRITVTGGVTTTVVITATGAVSRTITVNSVTAGTPGLSIASGSRLEQSAAVSTEFIVKFVPGGQAAINGDWYLNGDIDSDAFAYFELPLSTDVSPIVSSTLVSVKTGGSITIGNKGYTPVVDVLSENYLSFDAGSTLQLMTNAPIIPAATYAASSIILLTGVINESVSFEEFTEIGNLTYNCPLQANGGTPVYLNLLNLTIRGNLTIQSTNNQELTLLKYDISPGVNMEATISGNLDIEGNSKVAMSYVDATEAPSDLFVNGNLIANGTGFSLQSGSTSTEASTLHVGGNIQHTAGTFNALAANSSSLLNLFVIEMNGSTGQTIASHSSTFDNAQNEVTLRINNSNGVTLNSSLAVGKIDFNTANKGILSTNSFTLTINNTSATAPSVIRLPANKNLGFVNGTVRRLTSSVSPYTMPVGSGSTAGTLTVIPSSAGASVYEAKYFGTAHSSLNITFPIVGIANYYWNVNRISGVNAQVGMSFSSAVPGASVADVLYAAKFSGSAWINARGTTGTVVSPGNITSGNVVSELQSSFGDYTIAYSTAAALPTLLSSFTGKKTASNAVQLNWKITDNSTPSVFEVLRSEDGANFSKVGSVTGFEGKLNYEFNDNSITAGNNYYRLKMYDKDGSITFSSIIVIMNGTKGVMISSMMPTVVHSRSKLNISSSVKGNMQLVVTDISGRVIQNQVVAVTTGNQELWLDATKLAAGIFQITGYMNSEKTASIRFIKQ